MVLGAFFFVGVNITYRLIKCKTKRICQNLKQDLKEIIAFVNEKMEIAISDENSFVSLTERASSTASRGPTYHECFLCDAGAPPLLLKNSPAVANLLRDPAAELELEKTMRSLELVDSAPVLAKEDFI